METTKPVVDHIETILYKPFETMESLLMSISPMFREKFQEALYNKLANINSEPSNSSGSQQQEFQHNIGQEAMSQEALMALLNNDPADGLGTPWQ